MIRGVGSATHVVVDTMVVSWLLNPEPLRRAEEARRIVGDRIQIVSFITPTELRYGALKAGLGRVAAPTP